LIPGFALADSQFPTPVAPAATATLAGKINLDAIAQKRLPNTVADVTLAIQVDGRAHEMEYALGIMTKIVARDPGRAIFPI